MHKSKLYESGKKSARNTIKVSEYIADILFQLFFFSETLKHSKVGKGCFQDLSNRKKYFLVLPKVLQNSWLLKYQLWVAIERRVSVLTLGRLAEVKAANLALSRTSFRRSSAMGCLGVETMCIIILSTPKNPQDGLFW